VEIDRDSAAVIDDLHAAVITKGHFDSIAVASERFIDGVIDHLVDEMVKASFTRRADIHAWAFAYRLKTFEDCDR
jgi:hypothetical protein